MELIKILNDLGEEISSKIHRLNNGGCCMYAYEVAKLMPIDCLILVGNPYYDYSSIPLARKTIYQNNASPKNINSWWDVGIIFGHVFIEFEYEGKTYHYDSNGVRDAREYDPSFGFPVAEGWLTLEEAKTLNRQRTGWNTSYNRRQTKKVKKIICERLARYFLQA